MKTRLAIIAFLISGIFGLAFSPVRQDVPPRPVISIDAGGQTAQETAASYCWPIAQGNNKCDFAVNTVPQNPLTVDMGQAITIIIENSPGNPSSLEVKVTNANGEQIFNPAPAPQVIFEEDLPPGANTLEITAQYTNVAGTDGYITHIFGLAVLAAPELPTSTATATEIPPTSTLIPTELPTSTPAPTLTTVPPTQELVLPDATQSIATTEEPVEEPAQTEEAAETSGQMMGLATEEPTEEVVETEEAAVPTEEIIETEEPTEAALPTEEIIETEEATEAAVPTEEPTEEVAETEEAAAASATPVFEASPGGLPPQQEPPQVAERPTFTTVPLVVPGQENAVNPTATTVALASATPPPPASSGTPPTQPPAVQLSFAGQTFNPAAVIFCQTGANNQRTCNETRMPAAQPINVLQDSALQIRLDGSRPASVDIAFVDAVTSVVGQNETRPGDTLILVNVDVVRGRYILRVRFNWNGADAEYFFQLQVN